MRIITLLGNRAVCPSCSGTLIRPAGCEDYACIDCHSVFRVVDLGGTDRELIIKMEAGNG